MRIHQHLVNAVVLCLRESFSGPHYMDKIINREMKSHPRWGGRDRRFFAECTYDMTRWWRRLWYAVDAEVDLSDASLQRLFACYWWVREGERWTGLEQSPEEWQRWKDRYDHPKSPAVMASLPDWMYEKIAESVPSEEHSEFFTAINRNAEVVLRTNRLKIDRHQLLQELQAEGLSTEPVDNYPDALLLSQRANVFQTNAFKKGYFEVQDAASQSVAPLLQVEAKMRVIDACAGAGGKSLHLASLMQNKGVLIAMDIHEHKLQELRTRANRAGVSIIDTRPIHSTKAIKRLHESADRILLDVPCTGLGVLRRNPDTKWKLVPERLQELKEIQTQILASYSKMLKVGGKLVYATCSVLREENEEIIEHFLQQNPQWELELQERHFSHRQGFDGFYAARLRRNS